MHNHAADHGDDQAPSGRSAAPQLNLPKGGGAIRGIGEKFSTNAVTGTGTMSVPIPTSPSRSALASPELNLAYDSGSGNGPFGIGWNIALPSITRKTDKGLPRYRDVNEESDVFILSGVDDLVPVLLADGSRHEDDSAAPGYRVHRYRPRIEGLFARVERWMRLADGDIHWRTISKDNILTVYGANAESRIADPSDARHVFSWLICQSYDDKGNAIVYEYAAENADGVDLTQANERNRMRTANRYPKAIKYGNRKPLLLDTSAASFRHSHLPGVDWSAAGWMFEVIFDYGDGHYQQLAPDADGREFAAAHMVPPAGASWPARSDPGSSYRAGFEVRTYRLCRRVLMFHHFAAELGTSDCLVRSTEFIYDQKPIGSFITQTIQSGYQLHSSGNYFKRSLPPLEFEYTHSPLENPGYDGRDVRQVEAPSLENLPQGIDGGQYQWVDLDGEGISGVLTEQAGTWFYKPNLGNGYFGPTQRLAQMASLAALDAGHQQLLDLAGDGQLDLVQFEPPSPGFFERTDDAGWKQFQRFLALPNLVWKGPNLRFVDLTGDGHADLLITEDECLRWHPSLAEDGFDAAIRVRLAPDEEKGPRIMFADAAQTIFLADMSGDGMSDIVRIRNGDVSYWPNLGYGCFGAKVTMDSAPWFDRQDQFDQRRIRLVDTDGSGPTDILYLGADAIAVYLNQAGNAWSDARLLAGFPAANNFTAISVLDLLGRGTACLVWASPLPGDAGRPLRYLDLMEGRKPHLLVRSRNNLGAETIIEYASSTEFYLADKADGKPWVTSLPFPVQVVKRVETYDYISRNRFITRHAYHHGYFDGVEREFRGFGMVEQFDTEQLAALSASDAFPAGDNIDAASHVPPVHTKSWYHTGVYLGRDHVSDFFAGLLRADDPGEYYREPGLDAIQARARLLADTVLPDGLTASEEREACRALKGRMLRQEVYALDGSAKTPHPYTVTERNFTVRRLQAQAGNRHAVFLTHPRETLDYHYERNPADPRLAHAMTLQVDGFGNVLKSAAIAYGRGQADPTLAPEDQLTQRTTLVTYAEHRFTGALDTPATPDAYRAPLPAEERIYEMTGYTPGGPAGRFRDSDFVQVVAGALTHVFDAELSYESAPTIGRQRRLIEQVRTLYRRNDLSALLPLGTMDALALRGDTCNLALTPGLLSNTYQRLQPAHPLENLLPDPAAVLAVDVPAGHVDDRGGYLSSQALRAQNLFPAIAVDPWWTPSDADNHWWLPAARVFHSPTIGDSAAQELAHARDHFFMPRRSRDPFGQTAAVDYDASDLLILETRDAVGNRTTVGARNAAGLITAAGNDYRVLQARLLTDPNRNRTEVRFDALGMVAGTALQGKDASEGDTLSGFVTDPTQAELDGFLQAADPRPAAPALLAGATTRIIHDLDRFRRTRLAHPDDPALWLPACAATLARSVHASEAAPGAPLQLGFAYSDGFGREIQHKIQAEAGPLVAGGPFVTPRWVGSGWTIFNNKGKPVRQYEPFFSASHQFEFARTAGVSAVLCYDPLMRVVATLHPDHSWEKVVFDAWRSDSWDANDTVLTADPQLDPDVGDFFRRLPVADYKPTWFAQRDTGALGPAQQAAARKTALHAGTPGAVHADPLGRTFVTVEHNKFKYSDAAVGAPPTQEFYRTRLVLDIDGKQREVIDPQGRIAMRYAYDMLENLVHQASMEAGQRWMLNDVTGKPVRTWDSRGHDVRIAYDSARRPLRRFVTGADTANPLLELLVERMLYGEQHPDDELRNLRGKLFLQLDQAGVQSTEACDFKGNPLSSTRRLARQYKQALDWSAVDAVLPSGAAGKFYPGALHGVLAPLLEADTYTGRSRYDALNRPVQLIAPCSDQPGAMRSIIQPSYNEASMLERVQVWLDHPIEPAGLLDPVVVAPAPVGVSNIDYDAKGRRTLIEYSNGVGTSYAYDPLSFRLTQLISRRSAAGFPDDCPVPPRAGWPGCQVQNLHYIYDPVGNVSHIRDDAQQSVYFLNLHVEPSADYTYDACYRLTEATGREHLGQVGAAPAPSSYNDRPRIGIALAASDGAAMGRYLERYLYDAAGNFRELQHRGSAPANPGYTRSYVCAESSLLQPAQHSNRLSHTLIGTLTETYSAAGDGYDAHGNMLRMPQLHSMEWDYRDQLRMSQRQAVNALDDDGVQRQGECTWYVYDAGGQRVRKVTELASGQRKDERIYLGATDIYRRHGANPLVRVTLHVMDDVQRIALVETRTEGSEAGKPAQLIRYQFGNHLGSSSLELDELAQIISYEEYTPYGCTSYQAVRSQTETPKRYRYTGKERDEESGFYYHGARYYAPWLGRWTSCDPAGLIDGLNIYCYVNDNSLSLIDDTGHAGKEPKGAHGEGKKHTKHTKQTHEDANARRQREQEKRKERERQQQRDSEKKNPKKETDTERKQRENKERKEKYREQAEKERKERERQEKEKPKPKPKSPTEPVRPPVGVRPERPRVPVPRPPQPGQPVQPVTPPVQPVQPVQPVTPPVQPVTPPVQPVTPPVQPVTPPVQPQQPVSPPWTPDDEPRFELPHIPPPTPAQQQAVATMTFGTMLLIAAMIILSPVGL